MKVSLLLVIVFLSHSCSQRVHSRQESTKPCRLVPTDSVNQYFATYWPYGNKGSIGKIPPRVPLAEAETEMKKVFKVNRCLDLSDSLIQSHLQDTRGKHWYQSQLDGYPSSFKSLLVYQGTDFIVGYNYVVMMDENGRIQKLHKWGYGK